MEHRIKKRLNDAGLTEDVLMKIIHGDSTVHLQVVASEEPTYGILMGLFQFGDENSSKLNINSKILLKRMVDTLYPKCTIQRADRLYRRIQGFYKIDGIEDILDKNWRPQPTGMYDWL